MITNLEKQNIYLHDNFFEEYHVIYDFVLNNHKKDKPIYGICGEFFFDSHSGFPEQWISLHSKIGEAIKSRYRCTNATTSNALCVVVYEQGSFKMSHTDDKNILLDQNGLEVSNKFDYTSVFYLNNSFTGGNLIFNDLDIVIDPIPGRLVVFPSSYLHSVSKIESGTRFVISKFWKV